MDKKVEIKLAGCDFWFSKKVPDYVGIGLGYEIDTFNNKEVAKLIKFLTKAQEKMQ